MTYTKEQIAAKAAAIARMSIARRYSPRRNRTLGKASAEQRQTTYANQHPTSYCRKWGANSRGKFNASSDMKGSVLNK